MTLLCFLKLPYKSDSKYKVICLILIFNLLVGYLCIHSWRTITFISPNINSTNSSTGSRILRFIVSHINPQVSSEPVFPHPYKFIIRNSDFCGNGNILLLIILVCTAPDNFLQRQTIRETWGSVSSLSNNIGTIRVGFLLGQTSNLTVQKKIINESDAHADIMQEDFIDSYQNLTLKSVMLLKWTTTFCPNVQYVMKTDDDMYINTDNLIKTFQKLPRSTNILYGALFHRATPIRNASSKWFVPKAQFKDKFFPDYLSGTCYVMSRDAVPKLLEASYDLPFLVLEDVFITGLCANKTGALRVDMSGFDFKRREPTGCNFKDIVSGHRITPSEIRRIWTELHNKSLVCETPKTVATDKLVKKQQS